MLPPPKCPRKFSVVNTTIKVAHQEAKIVHEAAIEVDQVKVDKDIIKLSGRQVYNVF